MLDDESSVGALLHLIRAEYLEMPGLSLTAAQAQRLWNLPCAFCCLGFLEELVDAGFLRQTATGSFVRLRTDSPRATTAGRTAGPGGRPPEPRSRSSSPVV